MLHLLLGRALMRWLDKLGDDPSQAPPPSQPDSVEEPVATHEELTEESAPEPLEWVYPKVQRRAMGSMFEIYLAGTDREAMLAGGEEALDEVERLERQLSHYRDDSDIARLNIHAREQWVRLEPRLYELLKHCHDLTMATEGAFDITAGPLIKAWGFFKGEGRIPSESERSEILDNLGTERILFDDQDQLVYFTNPKLEINLGAIGKGFAVDAAARTLHFFGIDHAVIHGGLSTIYALGEPPTDYPSHGSDEPDTETESSSLIPHPLSLPTGWPFDIKDPRDRETVLETVYLNDQALSTSGNYEQFFEVDGMRYTHIIDPRSGMPVQGMMSVSVITDNAADSDALSTAFFVMGREATEEYCKAHPNIRVIMVEENEIDITVTKIGFHSPLK
jgi:thiamine biosynthesis lipoprotein